MKLAAYLRVSTPAQSQDGYGLDIQRKKIREWARREGHQVAAWHSDEGVSGLKDAFDREGLAAALQSVCDGSVGGLVMPDLDRIARHLHVQEAALGHVWQCGGRVFTVDGGEVLEDDPDDPMRTAMRQMRGVFHQLDRAMIAKRLRDGRRFKHEQGGYAFGAPGYGHRSEDGVLAQDDEEQSALFRMAQLRAGGNSVRDIAETLESEGYLSKRGNHWNPGTLSRVLRRLQAVLDKAPKDIYGALDEARNMNELIRNTPELAEDVQLTMARQRQGQGFRVILCALDDDDRRGGLQILSEATTRAKELLTRADAGG